MSAVIEVQNLHKKYGDLVAVDDVSFSVEEGEIFGILGPSGAGKTTTVECIEGLRNRDGGEINVLGLDPRQERAEITQQLGVQLQDGQLPDRMQVAEALSLYSSFYRNPADWRHLMDALGLSSKGGNACGALSGSQKQRLSVALALVGNPQVAVLDELTTELDPQSRRETWELIKTVRDSGVTILLVTRFVEEAELLCDRIAVIDKGRIAATDTPAGLAERVQTEQRIQFRPSAPLNDALLARLPDVSGVTRQGDYVVVTGNHNALGAVTCLLAHHQIVAEHLRVDQATLEDVLLTMAHKRSATL
ncbi:ABC-2 type transport system ATP-binding protein [Streptomyces griseochromogenes]|uniref:ABC-2 type transport system ATP-binding protein n=1 Tax=Streptomyces griseochromogenes TaxID=68214 RepID=A0ABS4LM68_9ACTN|nr:ABC transporter ATP-binding protein [Streptomyces griseochromogenes]MBP2048489.1 ABC-2 type transport system ATP-binding protein [Streptomyces griseochromogenes]